MVSAIPGLDKSKDLHKRINYVLASYNQAELFHLLVQLQKKADQFDILKKENKKLEKNYYEAKAESENIKNHWKVLQEHLNNNPSLKEEWDNLCMAIKLTEETD